MLDGQVKVANGLGLNSLSGVYHQKGSLAGGDAAANLVAKVNVTRSVNEVEAILLTAEQVVHLNGMALYGNAAFPLQIHVVEQLLHLLARRYALGFVEQAVGQGALAVVDVCNNAKVPNVLHEVCKGNLPLPPLVQQNFRYLRMAKSNRPALGRGLSALLNDYNAVTAADPGARGLVSGIFEVSLSQIQANPKQPRSQFEEGPLEELAESIRQLGIIQPITVRRTATDRFEIISGERRFRAAQRAGLDRIPVFVRLADDQQMIEMALVENIQRRDLDPMEVAFSFQRLMEECSLTQLQVSQRVGKQRSTVANFLGLLKLTLLVQAGLRDRAISAGHAKALVGLDDPTLQDELYLDCVSQRWSVRQLEEAVRLVQHPDGIPGSEAALPARPAGVRGINDLASAQAFKNILGLSAKVVKTAQGSGTVTLKFRSEEDLQKALKKLGF